MTLFTGRWWGKGGGTTLRRLHRTVHRNLSKRFSDTSKPASPTNPPPPPPKWNGQNPPHAPPAPKQRTIPGPSWAWIDPLMKPFRAYGRMQQRSPLMTQWESALVIWYLGDLSSQVVMTNVFLEAQYEPIRGLRAMLIGSISAIPGYKWFQFLGNHFNYRSHALSICVKVVVNQTCFTPVFNTYFFGMQTLLSGGSWAEAKGRVINTVPVSWRNSWKLWPAVTAFSFTFIPPQSRNIFASVIAIGWQTYLSWLNRTEENKHSKAEMEHRGLTAQGRVQQRQAQKERNDEASLPKKNEKKTKKSRKAEDGEAA